MPWRPRDGRLPCGWRRAAGWRRGASMRGRAVERLDRVCDVGIVDAVAEVVHLLLERSRWPLPHETGADEVVDGLAEADGALAAELFDGCGDVVGEGEGGTHAPSLSHRDAIDHASRSSLSAHNPRIAGSNPARDCRGGARSHGL